MLFKGIFNSIKRSHGQQQKSPSVIHPQQENPEFL